MALITGAFLQAHVWKRCKKVGRVLGVIPLNT